jgi:hypothetical protein
MGRDINGMLGLLTPGKREFRLDESRVTKDEFQASQQLHQYVFGEKGLADTLGPTWEMIHDPRFEKIETAFIRERRKYFNGDSRTGINKQLADGSFNSGVEDLDQYSEILGEGRHFHAVLRSMARHKAFTELYPTGLVFVPKGEIMPGNFIFNRLTPEQQTAAEVKAKTYSEFYPENLHKQDDDAIWGLIHQECPNYFDRRNRPNQVAKNLFAILKADLVGLINDYAEIAKLQEWILLDDENELVEQGHVETETPRVWAEVDMLERALSTRATLRQTAARIMNSMGISDLIETVGVTLTEFETDQLLKIVYTSNYPDDNPETVTKITSFLMQIKVGGLTVEQRNKLQCSAASASAREYVEKLKSGEEKPINRATDPGEEIEMSEEDKVMQQILTNPLKQHLFLEMARIENVIEGIQTQQTRNSERIASIQAELDDPAAYVVLTPGSTEAMNQEITTLTLANEKASANSAPFESARDVLKPVFETSTYELTEEKATELLTEVQTILAAGRPRKVEVPTDPPALPAPADVETITA